jgi:hypothetical protein
MSKTQQRRMKKQRKRPNKNKCTKKKENRRDPVMDITGNEMPTYLVLKLLLL